jgi:hypothetical protein
MDKKINKQNFSILYLLGGTVLFFGLLFITDLAIRNIAKFFFHTNIPLGMGLETLILFMVIWFALWYLPQKAWELISRQAYAEAIQTFNNFMAQNKVALTKIDCTHTNEQ